MLADAFSRMEPTNDPLPSALQQLARNAQALGFAPPGDASRMVDASLLEEMARR